MAREGVFSNFLDFWATLAYMVPSGQQIVLLYPLMLTWPGVLPPSYLPVVVPVASSELPFRHVQEFHG